MSFVKKKDALDYYRGSGLKAPCLFAEDINTSGSKRFHVTAARNIYNNMLANVDCHYYEFWTGDQSLVFGMDIDMEKQDDMDPNKIVKRTIKNVMKGAKEYYQHEYQVSDVIVLENAPNIQSIENPNRLSYHIIFRGLTFENHLVAKDFYLRLVKDYNMEYCDPSIYNITCFRLCFNSKKGKKAIAIPKVITIKGETTCFADRSSNNDLYRFWLKTMVTYIEEDDPIITKKQMSQKVADIQPTVDNQAKLDNINLEQIMFQLPMHYCDNYDTWIKMGMILKNACPSGNYFDLWDRWSQQSAKYQSKVMKKTWDAFKKDSRLTIGTLIYWCNENGIVNVFKNKRSLQDNVMSYPERPIELDKTGCLSLNQAKLVPSIYEPYLDKRMIAVQSEKGTGKTSNLLEVLFSSGKISKNTSVLFVSSRRTFGIKLLGDLKSEKFRLYSDVKEHYITSKRIICQVDSLMRLDYHKYDIVVVDECESLARYLTSSHFTKNPHSSLVVSTLKMRIREADHVYILDADLSVRCMNFYKNIMELKEDDYQLIVNDYKPYKDYTLVCMKYDHWLVRIMRDVAEGKRLVVPMASNAKAKDLYSKITMDHPTKKVLLIHKETSDEDKLEKLVNVNSTWKDYDIVIYTPSVCMGVSFDITGHFDRIYAYGCHMSLGAQEFCQMIHRVRDPIEKKIYVSMDYYKEYVKEEDTLTYPEVEEMMCSDYYLTHFDVHNNLVPKEAGHIVKSNGEVQIRRDVVLSYPYKHDVVYDLYVRNVWETIENKLSFTASFFGYAKHKAYQLEFEKEATDKDLMMEMKEIREKRREEEEEKDVTGIMEAKDITDEEFKQKEMTKDEYITDKDKYEMRRYKFRKCYNIEDELTKDVVSIYKDVYLQQYYRKLSTIMATNAQTTTKKLQLLRTGREKYTDCYKDFTIKNHYLCHAFAIKALQCVGVDINNLEVEVSEADMQKGMDEFMEWAEDPPRKLNIAMKFQLNIRHKRLTDMNKVAKIKLFNSIVDGMYGIKFKKKGKAYEITGMEKWEELPRDDKILPVDLPDSMNEDNRDMFDEDFDFNALDEGIEN
jgi:hypothetical protein